MESNNVSSIGILMYSLQTLGMLCHKSNDHLLDERAVDDDATEEHYIIIIKCQKEGC